MGEFETRILLVAYKDKETQRAYQLAWVNKRRNEFFNGKSCVQCGDNDRLELDHIDPSSKVTNKVWSWSKVRRDEELAKCQVLCYSCHKAKTKIEKSKDTHGTAKYRRGCRCRICKDARSAYVRQWRAKNDTFIAQWTEQQFPKL